ncbi:TPM domain-containing protein [Candidatus Margulisiibacteriota bacterium]
MLKKVIILVSCVIAILCTSNAFTLEPFKLDYYVTDKAMMMSSSERDILEKKLYSFYKETTAQIVVVTIPSLQGEVLEEFSIALAELNKIGTKGADNGLLILISKNDRKIRIEVGYGLEDVIPDVSAKLIIDTVMTPAFKAGNFYKGIDQAVDIAMEAIKTKDFSSVIEKYVPKEGPLSKDEAMTFALLGAILFCIGFLICMGIRSIKGVSKNVIGNISPVLYTIVYIGSELLFFHTQELLTEIYAGSLIIGSCIGLFVGIFISLIIWAIASGGSSVGGGGYYSSSGWTSSSSSSSSSGGFSSGGFSGGGGSFGGGGASGGW